MPSPIEKAVEIHGHLGPHVVIGAKMALYAQAILGTSEVSVISEARKEPPQGCMNDGLRAICTEVRVSGKGRSCATFISGKNSVRISLQKGVSEKLESRLKEIRKKHGEDSVYFREVEKIGKEFETYLPEQLFTVQGSSTHFPEGTKE